MKTIYVDADFKCHAANDGAMRPVETDFFDGKCEVFLEGYRFVPAGETWTRPDGSVFQGEMIVPWKPFEELDKAQREYERQMLKEYEALIDELYREVTA